jgi:hypothetical protein
VNRRTILQSIIGAAIAPDIPVAKIKPLGIIGTGTLYDPLMYRGSVTWINQEWSDAMVRNAHKLKGLDFVSVSNGVSILHRSD